MHLKAIAKYLPGPPISSAEIEQRLGWPVGWIEQNSGVLTRHHAGPEDSVTGMGAVALQAALTRAEWGPGELDLLLFAAASYDYPIPHTACLLKAELGWEAYDFPAFDVDATCLSFLNACEIAAAFIESGRYRRVAIVTSELSSRSLDPADRKTYSLFGDGAVAALLEPGNRDRPTGTYFVNHAAGAKLAWVPAGGNATLANRSQTPDEDYYFNMQGRHLLKLTFEHIGAFIEGVEAKMGRSIKTFAKIIPHQASRLGMEMFLKRFGLDPAQVQLNLHRYGNCIAASIPLGLCDLVNETGIESGSEVILMGTAAGLSMGAVTLEV